MNEERLDSIEKRIADVEEQLSLVGSVLAGDAIAPPTDKDVNPESQDAPPEEKGLIEIPEGEEAPWVQVARTFFHKNEIDDNEELKEFLEGIDPAEIPWCAYFVDKCLEMSGCNPLNSGRAADFEKYGKPCEKREGAIAVFDGHVGFVVANEKILGGNQGDMVRENNLAWYLKNKTFLGYRFPDGYVV